MTGLILLTGCFASRPGSLSDRGLRPDAPTPQQDVLARTEAPVALLPPQIPHVEKTHWVYAMVTAYSPDPRCCGYDSYGFTSTHVDTRKTPYGIAVDPALVPYGTLIHIPGYLDESHPGTFWVADDTGSAMRRDGRRGVLHLDIRFRSFETAVRWGVRWEWVEILDPVSLSSQ